ncbi:PDR2 [Ecytonucleospora hepatopenaei]|uniref:PDR2 n=1 Tax=Ecytonucleospora hepatopenaei TaxID=646526 RepID=A0A1W0E3T1_9MICR|nr:PDR2 [Ecytonucleospora hepatopenaei]
METIKKLQFFRKSDVYVHLYLIPMYLLPFSMRFSLWYEFSILGISVSLLLYLSTFWSVKSHVIQCFGKITHDDVVNNNDKAFILFGRKICQVQKEKDVLFFIFENKKFLILNKCTIERVFPSWESYTIGELKNQRFVQKHKSNFMPNVLHFPAKTFLSLYKEQITAPLFCFSIFSSVLTLFDDYVYNSLLSIGIGFAVEAMMTLTRLATLKMFQTYKIETSDILIEKERDLKRYTSDSLKPGDIVVFKNTSEFSFIKLNADFLILNGNAVVNEAMLSGESVPLLKQEVEISKKLFSFERFKKHILFSGTELLKIEKCDKLRLLCLRTGFDTEQGQLLSKMIYNDTVEYDKEALKFVFILTCISILASFLTFFYSKKKGYDLFLDILILFTNSIPFELPMEMGMALQMASRSLFTKKIFCLEPHKIQLAGKLDVCCFDKTGTLTETNISLEKLVVYNEKRKNYDSFSECTDNHLGFLLSSCNDLQVINDKIEGDPLDKAVECFLRKTSLNKNVVKEKEFAFQSEKKKQSVYVKKENQLFFVTKGAPEVIQKQIGNLPKEYDNYKKYANDGYRVISLAYKKVTDINGDDVEDLHFVCFLLFTSSLKEYAKEMVSELKNSNHKVVMITGDNKYTAKCIAQKLEIMSDFCNNLVEGDLINKALENDTVDDFVVFARANPEQKEKIVRWFRKQGKVTMMVGDGTNDVGALKVADVGIAMLETRDDLVKKPKTIQNQPQTLSDVLQQFKEDSVKPGDASVAAPFTVKSNSLKAILEIVLQGRTTACTTVQMYKILAINSLISAFTMSFLDLFGIKFSEKQMLSLGILNSVAFNAISRGKTLNKIANKRMLSSIFNFGFMGSVLSQGILHTGIFAVLIYLLRKEEMIKNFFLSSKHLENIKFEKSKVNSTVYALGMCQTIATFAFNYIGRPFREDISENAVLFGSLVAMMAIPLNIILNINVELNEYLECVDLEEYKGVLVTLCAILLTSTWIIDKFTKNKMLR